MKVSTILMLLCGLYHHAFSQLNDDCADAIMLTVSSQCSAVEFSNQNATSEEISTAPDPTCGSFVGADVWFKLNMPVSGALRVEVDDPFSAVPPSFTLYSGNCGNFQELVCARTDHGKTINNRTIAGALVFIRVYNYFSQVGRRFNLCVFEPEIPLNDQCENALLLQVDEGCQPEQYSSAYGTTQSDTVAPLPGCGQYRGGDIWFKVVMPSSGLLRIDKERISGSTHPAMVAYRGSCNDFETVYCSSNDPTVTIDDSSLSGQMIYLRFFSYASEEGASFSLCIYEQDTPPNDDCSDAITLPVGVTCAATPYTNHHATEEPVNTAPLPACNSYMGGDVWFAVVVPLSGLLQIETESQQGTVPPSIAVYSGECENFKEVACIQNDKSYRISDKTLAGETLQLRVFSFNSRDGGIFFLCAFEPPCIPYNVDSAIAICKDETHIFGSQTISKEGQYTELFQSQEGCDSLVTLTVKLNNVDTSVTNQNGTLSASASGATYQWVDCQNAYAPIIGAVGQSFQADSGEYAAIVTQNSCVDTTSCYVPSLVVAIKDDIDDEISFFPNPAADNFYIDFHGPPASVSVEVVDMNGRTIKSENFQQQSLAEIDTRWLPTGAYVVRLQTENGITTMKLIKD